MFPSKGFALLALLVLSMPNPLTRQYCATMLWEDVDQKKAMANLRQLLVRVRKFESFAHEVIEIESDTLAAGRCLNACDLAAFVASEDLPDQESKLLRLSEFRGELLQGIDLDGAELSRWLQIERQKLTDRFITIATEALLDITRFGAAEAAAIDSIAGRILALEPDNVENYKAVVEAYSRGGNVHAAERASIALQKLLNEEKGAPPGVRLKAAYSQSESSDAAGLGFSESSQSDGPARPKVAFFPPELPGDSRASDILRALLDDVANNLARFRSFAVIATYSSYAYADDPAKFAERSLDCEFAVSSILIPGGEVISIRLEERSSGEIIWSAEYGVKPEQLMQSFRLIAKQIANMLAEQIERYRHNFAATNADSSAYLHYLNGQTALNQCTLPFLRRARKHYRQALKLESNWADARARVAQTILLEWLVLGGTDPHLLHRAKAETNAAMELDPGASIGHWVAAVIALYQREYEKSSGLFLEAEALSPNSADLLLQHADALAHFGDPEAAWPRFLQAVELNPFAPDRYWWAGASIAFDLSDYEESVRLCGLMENDEPALRVLTASLALGGHIDEARGAALRLSEIYPDKTAEEIVSLSPDQDLRTNRKFMEGLRMAGLK